MADVPPRHPHAAPRRSESRAAHPRLAREQREARGADADLLSSLSETVTVIARAVGKDGAGIEAKYYPCTVAEAGHLAYEMDIRQAFRDAMGYECVASTVVMVPYIQSVDGDDDGH